MTDRFIHTSWFGDRYFLAGHRRFAAVGLIGMLAAISADITVAQTRQSQSSRRRVRQGVVATRAVDRDVYHAPVIGAASPSIDDGRVHDGIVHDGRVQNGSSLDRQIRDIADDVRPVSHQNASSPHPAAAIRAESPVRLADALQPLIDLDSPYDSDSPYGVDSPAESIVTTGYYGGDAVDIGGSASLGCDACGFDIGCGCESSVCDYGGCDAAPRPNPRPAMQRGRLSFDRCDWFGSVDVLLNWRDPTSLPTLVTTGSGDSSVAGTIGNASTTNLVDGTVFDDLAAGGRVTIGTFLDDCRQRSLVLRGWYGGEDEFSFFGDQNQFAILTRPFNNVTTDAAGVADTVLINFPGEVQGSLAIEANSEVYGGDASFRQIIHQGLGASIEMLYGYQFMRLEEGLNIRSTATSLDDAFAPIGSVISIADDFESSNEFHGGQIGLAMRYNEGCWGFRGLLKTGFGSLQRRVVLGGSTTTTIDAATAVDPQGLLVRNTNAGVTRDRTFAWTPEVDATLTYRRFPNYDISVGYHLMVMTDAVRLGDVFDPNLSSNLSTPLVGSASPTLAFRDETFFVQGIHFGLLRRF